MRRSTSAGSIPGSRRRCRGSTRFDIRVDNPDRVAKGVASVKFDGTDVAERPLRFDLAEDGGNHEILVIMG
jgi:cyclic beta-1,2-glucan synthetase